MAFPGLEQAQTQAQLPVIPWLPLASVLKLLELRIDPVMVQVLVGFRPIRKLKPEFQRAVPADSEALSLG